jgi:hypothetical protein
VMTLSILLRFHHGPSKAPSQTQEKNGLARRLTAFRSVPHDCSFS